MKLKIVLSLFCLFYISSIILLSADLYTPGESAGKVLRAILELLTIPVVLAVPAQVVSCGFLYFRTDSSGKSGFLAPLIINLISLIIMIVATLAGI
ncbi:hypothetical protein H1R16_07595 [Marnyiella aurantia]|uniref:Uncharacterized protein n=1 Tax=Marnyiella aurantia TaxID=2758037 RepID=A0A7D7QUW4_9FLAO|nr:hypothetical protein [Marnyiella aurantia]MBA5247077.1 hypothetical protein [Marnyiella aurantia]QMS97590.1 hypothetical protein H1R16_07595 [Marnyiella aurantia]